MRVVKKAIEMGNGAAVYIPREYRGQEVVVILPEGIEYIKKKVLGKLIEFMPNILGVYIYGSYVRGEEKETSDVDLLVIVKKENARIKEVLSDIDARVLTIEELKNSIKNLPAITLPILKEAEPILNPLLLEELKKSKINFKKFKWHFDDIKRVIKIIERFIELDPEDISASHFYSLIMRFRILYMMECLLKNKNFSNKKLKEALSNYGLSYKEYEKYYEFYQRVRDDEDIKEKIEKEKIEELINILKKYTKKVENETKKKIKKRN